MADPYPPISDGGGRNWTDEEKAELCRAMAELFAKPGPHPFEPRNFKLEHAIELAFDPYKYSAK